MEKAMKSNGNTRVVLVVEDSPTQSISVKTLLEREGVRCILASDGQTGLYLAQSLIPDAIILDLEMPQMNGFQVCQHLKAEEKTAEIPVILMTRHDEASMVVQGLELGAVEFIPKDTFSDAVLVETLKCMDIIKR
jgi:DNA-binding response OmpR family regulator